MDVWIENTIPPKFGPPDMDAGVYSIISKVYVSGSNGGP
jgi:hypothetical protein